MVTHKVRTATVLRAARALVSLAAAVVDAVHLCHTPSPDAALVGLFNCIVFGKLSCFVRCVFLLPPDCGHPLWHALGSPEYALVSTTLTAAFTASRVLRAAVVLAAVLAAVVLLAVPQPRAAPAPPVLHARCTKLVWDLADADVLTRGDCVRVLAKLDAALRKVRAARQQRPAHGTGTEGGGTCVVCMDAPACGTLQPCGHAVLCRACAETVRATTLLCPCCRLPCFAGVTTEPAGEQHGNSTREMTMMHEEKKEEESDVVWSSSGED